MRRQMLVLVLVALTMNASAQFAYRIQSPLAAESFRTGVEAYGKGRYAEALSLFERALATDKNDPLCLYWLGKSYYKLGISGVAFARWNDALSIAGPSPFVESRLELAGAASNPAGLPPPDRYVRVAELMGDKGKTILFSRPSWVEPRPDGSAYLVSHGTNTILHLDANARIIQTINAGSSGFDRPFACAVISDGTMFVTEFEADRVARMSPDGRILGYLGDASGPGRLSGPQYITADADDFIYVVDVGFARVVKYASTGAMVLSFGARNAMFDGLTMPTGIAIIQGRVFVADSAQKAIFVFDTYGNYIGTVSTVALERPEGLRATADGRLLLADSSRVLLIDPETGAAQTVYRSERRNGRIVSAAFDANGELLAADFDASELAYLSDPVTRFSGLSVEVSRVDSSAFPRVALDVRVQDRYGRPMTGLGISNFYVSEGITTKERRIEGEKPVDYLKSSIQPALDLALDGTLDASTRIDMVMLLEGSPAVAGMRLEARDAVAALYASLGGDASAQIVIAGKNAQPPVSGGAAPITKAVLSLEASDGWRFDSGLRLASAALFNGSGRRALVHIGTGSVNEATLDGPSLSELASILIDNGITFYAVIIGKSSPSELLTMLAQRTGGAIYRADRPEGVSIIAQLVRAHPTGTYRLSYRSTADDGFGKSYIPFNVEVYLRDRSGKEESGFFAPLR
ncbi:MAG TPA: tetratricopeptide repeat protein [bacterium]|nr:tetratricopeptide repeat protein [bacterium]